MLTTLFTLLQFVQARFGLVKNERGATAVEYGLIVAVIALVMVVGAGLLGTSISDLFGRIADDLDARV
jgi:pilus assembly protein Flp/PilA